MSHYIDIVADINPGASVLQGYDDCIIGISSSNNVLVYSKDKIIDKLKNDMSIEDALEWYSYNMVGALDYLCEGAPIFCEEW